MRSTLSHLEAKQLALIGAVLCILLVAWILFAPSNSVFHYIRTGKTLEEIQAENKELLKQNALLKDEIKKLKNDPAYIEEMARKRYGLVRENEMIYDFGPKKK